MKLPQQPAYTKAAAPQSQEVAACVAEICRQLNASALRGIVLAACWQIMARLRIRSYERSMPQLRVAGGPLWMR